MASFKQWLEAQLASDGTQTNPTGTINQSMDIARNAMAKPAFSNMLSKLTTQMGNKSAQRKELLGAAQKAVQLFPGHPGDVQPSTFDVARGISGEMGLKLPSFKPLGSAAMRRMMRKMMQKK